MKHRKGFSLIELAIVIVIVATIVAAISVSINLYTESQMRSVVMDMQKYGAYYKTFKDRYHLPPGDFNQAQALWGTNCADTVSCNGNGDTIVSAEADDVASEVHRAWKHLEQAEILNHQIPVVPATWNGHLAIEATPKSQIAGAGYYFAGDYIGFNFFVDNSPFGTRNAIWIGKEANSNNSALVDPVFTGLEVYNLDKKFDDGRINSSGVAIGLLTGKLRFTFGEINRTLCTASGGYNVTDTNKACNMGMLVDEDNL